MTKDGFTALSRSQPFRCVWCNTMTRETRETWGTQSCPPCYRKGQEVA